MKSNFIKYLALVLALTTLIVVGACPKPETKTPETPEPAKFAVSELAISPDTVMPSDEVTVTATIDNTGGTEGTYTAILTMDGQELERKDVLIGPGATNTAVSKLTSPETDGDYTLSVGGKSMTLHIFPWVDHTIQYDNAKVNQFWTSWTGYGFLSYFQIPSSTFRIKDINIYGQIWGLGLTDFGERSFTLRIWDKKISQELYSADYPYNLFTTNRAWVKVEVPDLRVDSDFYVEVVTNAEQMPGKNEIKCGLLIGLDLSATEGNADEILNGVVQPWDTTLGAKETAAWMVRVGGERGPKLEQYTLIYDDGQARDSLSYSDGGHIVDFSPAATPFTIKKIRIAGQQAGEGTESLKFDLQILDKDLKVLYSATYPYSKFTHNATTWIEFEVPDIEVTDKFYVHVYTLSPRYGLHIGADDSVVNEHSDVTIRTAEGVITILAEWPYDPSLWFGDKSKVNWMIRVKGTTLED